jgi:hypothetical protein
MLRNREGEILFVDLRTWNENIYEKKFVKLSEEQIAKVCKIYFDWATTKADRYAEPELYYAAHLDEIKKKGFSLVPSRYIEFVEHDVENDWQVDLKALSNNNSLLKNTTNKLQQYIDKIYEVLKTCITEDKRPYRIGKAIKIYDKTNTDNLELEVLGLNRDKEFMPTVANVDSIDTKKYKIVSKGVLHLVVCRQVEMFVFA